MRNMIMEPVTRVRAEEEEEGGGRVPVGGGKRAREEKREAGKDAKRAKEGKYAAEKGKEEKLPGNQKGNFRKTRRERKNE